MPLELTDSPDLRRAIARAVLDNLEDRRGIKWQLLDLRDDDPETYAEIEETIAAKVMAVLVAQAGP